MMPVETPFKRGTTYTRKEVGQVLLPETGRPSGGMWDTGYVRVENFLVVFMNIGVPGKGGFDFINTINSGFKITGDAKDMVTVKNANEGNPFIIVTQNRGKVNVFQQN